jgi:hypothetical protein
MVYLSKKRGIIASPFLCKATYAFAATSSGTCSDLQQIATIYNKICNIEPLCRSSDNTYGRAVTRSSRDRVP